MNSNLSKAPRLFGEYKLAKGVTIPLSPDHNHYLLSVMRRQDGDYVRLFNGKDGEYYGTLAKTGKKTALLTDLQCTRTQPVQQNTLCLYAPLIKKDRFAFMIEKAVELGVTDIIPFTSDHTDTPRFNAEKTQKHIIEAAEQCERLTIPKLGDVTTLDQILQSDLPFYCAVERQDGLPPLSPTNIGDYACLIGPEGGWSDREITALKQSPKARPVSLGDTILRAETAAIYMLARLAK